MRNGSKVSARCRTRSSMAVGSPFLSIRTEPAPGDHVPSPYIWARHPIGGMPCQTIFATPCCSPARFKSSAPITGRFNTFRMPSAKGVRARSVPQNKPLTCSTRYRYLPRDGTSLVEPVRAAVCSRYQADIPQMTSKSVENVPPFLRQGNGILSAAIQRPDFGDRLSSERPFDQIFRHSDTPFPPFSPGRRFSRPTPERVLVADHRSGAGFSGTVPSARQPRPVGT